MKHTHRPHRLLAWLLVLVMVMSMFPVNAYAAGTTIVGTPETVQVGTDAAAERENDFNKGWKFYLGDNSSASNPNFDDSAWEAVDLPHDFSITQHFTSSGEAESGFLPGGTGWYRKSFVIAEEHAGKTFLLNFDGVYMNAYVYVNGQFVGEHHYGYTNFAFDITDYLTCDGATQNVVAVKAVNELPSSRWYSGSGIYRDVTLYALEEIHVDLNGVTVTTPDIADGSGNTEIKVDVVNDGRTSANVTVKATAYFDGQPVAEGTTDITAAARSTTEAALGLEVEDPALWSVWSVGDPNLYTLKTEVIVNGQVVDTDELTYGYRWFTFNSEGFQLNGENLKLNGVCMHHDQGALGAAAYYDAMYRQMVIMKEMGANAIRITHNPGDEDLIAICNELGLLVIEETFDGLVDAKNGNYNDFSGWFEEEANAGLYGYESGMSNAEYAARSITKRDKNAACIFAWSFGNEIQEGTYWTNVSRYDEICADYISWVNDEDGTRFVTSGCNNRGSNQNLVDVINTILDAGGIAGFNYANAISGGNDRDLSALATRFGGDYNCIIASETASATNSRGQYKNQYNNSNSDGKYHLTSYDTSSVGWGITAHDSIYNTYALDNVAGEFVWTGFDYIGEPTPWNGTGTGSVSGSGAIPNSSYFGIVETTGFAKDSYYLYRAQWNKKATTVHLVTAWDADNQMISGGKTPVWVYTNAAKVELYLNGSLIGTTTRTVNTTAAGHVTYTYTAESNNTSVCSVSNGSGADALYSVFNVAYTAGTLKAVAYDENGVELDTYSISTPGTVTKLVATANRTEVEANGYDLIYVEVDVTDADGNLKTTATNNITFSVDGPAVIAGVDNGDQATVRKFQNDYVLTSDTTANIDAYAGKALVILRATEEGGEITLNIASSGLEGQTITVNAVGGTVSADEGIVSYEMVRDYTIMAGTAPELDTAITGCLADGTTVSGTIVWNEVSEELCNTAGDHTISGVASFEGYADLRVSARLHVIPNIVALRNVSAATTEGALPTLPAFVSGVLANGTLSGEFAVEWDMPEASEFDTVGEIVTVTGTAVVFGEETRDVTCTVRVAESVNAGEVNVAPMAETVSQDVPSGYESDNLNSINNEYKQFVDNTSERWTNWNYRTYSDSATLTLTWATAQIMNGVNLYYYYDNCCAYPEAIEFSYSLNGEEYEVIGYTEELVESATLGAMYTYTFEEPVNPVALQVKLTQQGGTSGAHCVGLIEMEVMTYDIGMEVQTGAALSGIAVDGTAIEGFDPATYTYEIEGDVVTATADENVGITILPEYKGYIRILTVSEDGASSSVYTLLTPDACRHENTETIEALPATCTETGLSEGTKCADCGEILVAQEETPALGHTEEVIPGTPATFDEKGTSDGVKCSVCGLVLVAQEETPALDYNADIIPIPVLTATAGDSQSGEGPERVLDDDLSTLWHTDWYGTSRDDHWIQFELGEEYIVDGLRYKPRTSGGTNGIITEYEIQVSNDGENFTTVTSGEWENDRTWKVVEFEGQNVKYVRLVSLASVSDQPAYVFSSAAEIRLTGVKAGEAPDCQHTNTEVRNASEATCTEAGYTGDTYCVDCGEKIAEGETIAATGHTWTDATCTAPKTCSVCGVTEGEALGHDWKGTSCQRCDAKRENPFTDVPEDSFYIDPVLWAVEKGITTGATETLFNPEGDCLRGHVVTFLWRAAGSPEPTSTYNPFSDVTENDFFYKAVLWAVEKGITNGTSATEFSPYKECNRAQVVTFLWRSQGSPDSTAEVTFTDVEEGQFYTTAVAWAVENGITNGMGDGTFGVEGVCNRAQVVTFLYRTLA